MQQKTKLLEKVKMLHPHTGEALLLKSDIQEYNYKGETYSVELEFYFCEKSKDSFTTTALDCKNMQKIYRLEAERLADTLVIVDYKVYRLVGMAPDDFDEHNYCYILDGFKSTELKYVVDLTGFIRLKKHLRDVEYNKLVQNWNWNWNNKEKIKRTDSNVFTFTLIEGNIDEMASQFYRDSIWIINEEEGLFTVHTHKKINLNNYPKITNLKQYV
jgi:hypothetical protein